ncbi:formate dehydrogenase accessory sulfurtransferase FdhD [Oribacterium sp. WCC10]|uniref:formate dehydrogenase accessory sulfurtransferase FdhD n=1 Tax=Oribacterium sp. WCC10 TaxID=1855343 RepID=UPI0008F33F3E|nr:formate dehydrogenase accessory sulfurtransferase FdhD [Oribacterium sp. WCC10]SFG18860.1 FdhD protein [Oribacterium sp. WCC10]
MIINEQYENIEKIYRVPVTVIAPDGSRRTQEKDVLYEHLMDVYINDHLTMKLVCVPEYLSELVLGRMLTEGIIESCDDVEMIYICREGARAKVLLKNQNKEKDNGVNAGSCELSSSGDFVETTPTCCTGNHVLNDYFVHDKALKVSRGINWKRQWVDTLIAEFRKDTPVHKSTSSTHSAYLMTDGVIRFVCEDIGRHNAVDKCIGYALRNDYDLSQCVLYTTGRVPTDMMEKVIRAGVPMLVSKEYPTREAIELASKYGTVLIGNAKRDDIMVFNECIKK